MEGKIIGVGFQKTGTSSLRDALRVLGYRVGDTKTGLLFPILKGNFKRVLKEIKRYDAVEDNPWLLVYKELDEAIPNCKFILTIRDPESWYDSVCRHIGDLRSPMHEWIYGRGKGLPKDDKTNTLKVYNAHNQGVIDYFKDRPEDLLVIDLTKDKQWAPLCGFLKKELPAVPFPHANKYSKKKVDTSFLRQLKVLKKRIKYAIQLKYIDWMKYF